MHWQIKVNKNKYLYVKNRCGPHIAMGDLDKEIFVGGDAL